MLQILTRSQASSGFFKYLQAFGRKGYAQDEGFSGCDTKIIRDVAGAPETIGRCRRYPCHWIHSANEQTQH